MLDAGGSGGHARFLLGEFGQVHAKQGIRRVGARVRGQIDAGNLRVEQVRVGGLLGTVQELVAIDDLHDAVAIGAVAEVDAIAVAAHGHGAMQFGGRRARWSPAAGPASRNCG